MWTTFEMVMAPRRNKTRGKATAAAGSKQVPRCAFCDLPHSDDINGELLSRNGLHVHYFCMLFSSGLHQRGEEEDPLRGFLETDVRAELRRGNRLICCFCKRRNATVGCCLRACKKAFHMPCGVDRDCLLQFFGDFRVYCAAHRPRQNVVPLERDGPSLCSICSEEMVHPSVNVLVTPCCRQMFHRGCIQRQAMSAGSHFFRCGHCNNQEAFQREMQDHGIYVPDQDASWEQEPHAYEELLYRYQHCDAPRCSCPLGRSHHQEDSRWRMVVCDSCGSQGVHASCGNVAGTHWVCADCRQIITRVPGPAQQPSSSRIEKRPPQHEVIEIDSDDDDDVPPQQLSERKKPSGCRLLDFSMRGANSDDSSTLQLMLETINGSVIVAVVAQEP